MRKWMVQFCALCYEEFLRRRAKEETRDYLDATLQIDEDEDSRTKAERDLDEKLFA